MIVKKCHPRFWQNHELCELEKSCGLPLRLAYLGLWVHTDVNGCFPWKPDALKRVILPKDDVSFEDILSTLLEAGYIVRPGEKYGHIPITNPEHALEGLKITRPTGGK
jgi:hypothetical protein